LHKHQVMKICRFLFLGLPLFMSPYVQAQKNVITPDLSEVINPKIWSVSNRKVTFDNAVYLDKKPGDGVLWLNKSVFANCKIELDIKGTNQQGASFVGVAFHGLNDSVFEAIYFRPFNFKSPERRNHSVQYVAEPEYSWSRLREEFPGKYENEVNPVPDPDAWFHVSISIEYPVVKVFVDNSESPSLNINQLSFRKQGWIGFWVGNTSDGYFKNLKISPY
jgi:hypothetical protein